MLVALKCRAAKQGLKAYIEPRHYAADDLSLGDLRGRMDLALAFWMLHEVPEQTGFLLQMAHTLCPEGRLLIAEPKFHVSQVNFASELDFLLDQG
ncbi:hypothetical protein DFAR_2730032 [Desulfarculales bacterium]